MTVYFDTNIYAYIENGSLSVRQIEDSIGVRFSKIFYSASHIQESIEIKGISKEERENRINKRLHTISELSESNYLYEDLENNVFKLIENPFSVLKTITEVVYGQEMMKGFANFISEEQKESLRNLLCIEPSRMNNYSPTEVIQQFNKKLHQTGQEFTFLSLMEYGMSFHPNSETFGLSNKIAGIFELLDMFGYWKDKYTDKSNYARLWDSSHTSFAAFCDYFISDDKRTRNKAKVVYDIYNIGTKVLSSKGEE